ncbi:hypothetical protein BDW59DRAFT_170831 [Aspergillus cavernicola]|uniref:CCZ1/INTU/HSP4 first Longin domain-containing protein n=1 Tax=Aspergillus cavernicola TaxID=176166 RepID=A0ABR4IM81_9EURO
MPESDSSSVAPAQLSFLAIYNPLLGTTDETLQDQLVFYTSRSSLSRRRGNSTATDDDKEANDDRNGRLRQIGLAQGMVSFARNFSEGKAVDYVETEKSQIILHELEKDWWILASVDLTRLPVDPNNGPSSQRDASEATFHYSSREMTPPQLLIQQLRRAHSIFLLHHASSLDALYKSVGRSTFCLFIENFWLRLAWNWEVLLSGNPAVEMYNGVKLSAGGELGIGVGEEEWGSGEREVLEDFVSRTDGLVDLVVARFGDPYDASDNSQTASKPESDAENRWLGSDAYPRPSDGVIFSGVDAINRQSLVSISQWMEWIYRYGTDAYGIGQDPTSPRRRKRRKRQQHTTTGKSTDSQPTPHDASRLPIPDRPFPPGIPRPLVRGTPSPQPSSKDHEEKAKSQASDESSQGPSDKASDWMAAGTETFVKYLTLGYGSSWSLSRSSSPRPQIEAPMREDSNEIGGLNTQEALKKSPSRANHKPRYQNSGRFIIGLQDGSASPDIVLEETEPTDLTTGSHEKIAKRTIHLHLANSKQDATDAVQLRAIVYIHQPFIYTFLFDTTTPSLSDPSLYHRIHHQLGPLQKPLSNSTSPSTASCRISNAPELNKPQQQHQPIYDLVYDPHNLSIRSSIPNIPDLIPNHQPQRPAEPPSLSRIETISIHHRLLTTYIETRSRPLELERTCKTSRGWWIVWVRVSSSPPPIDDSLPPDTDKDKDKQQEALIICQASDHPSSSSSGHSRNASSIGGVGSSSSARFFRDLGGASSLGVSLHTSRMDIGPAKLVEGLGLDARRYIENLLSLNR